MNNPEPDKHLTPVRERLLREGAKLFAKKGYGGTSVREICDAADASSRMIHHYFGSKQGLYDALIDSFKEGSLDVPIRIITSPPTSAADFATRLELFISETLEAAIANRYVYEMVIADRLALDEFRIYYERFHEFLRSAQSAGVLRETLDVEMLTGLVLDRVGNQIYFAEELVQLASANVINDPAYRSRWVRANVDLILNGMLA